MIGDIYVYMHSVYGKWSRLCPKVTLVYVSQTYRKMEKKDIPVDWMNGRSLLYERTTDFFRLWSVGEDGVDQGGDPLHPRKNNWWMNGVDFVWPTAATPEETRQYAEDRFAEWKAATTKP